MDYPIKDTWINIQTLIETYEGTDLSQVRAFFSRLSPQVISEGFMMITAETTFIRDWVEKHYSHHIQHALHDIYGTDFVVMIEFDPQFTQAQVTPYPSYPEAPTTYPNTSQVTTQHVPVHTQIPLQSNSEVPTSTPSTPTQYPTGCTTPIQQTMNIEQVSPAQATYHSEGAPNPNQGLSSLSPETIDEFKKNFPHIPTQLSSTQTTSEQAYVPMPVSPLASDQINSEVTQTSGGLLFTENYKTSNNDSITADEGFLSHHTFENFVIGESNRVAYEMALSVANKPMGNPTLNPLFIYGRSGLGKTHLLRSIENYIRKNSPEIKTCYIDSSELVSAYTEASLTNDTDKQSFRNFNTKFDDVNILLIDDVQYLQDKPGTLNQVFNIFNRLTSQGKQIVLAADRAPKNIDIDERVQSRFNSGGSFDIQAPKYETKLGIVRNFIKDYMKAEQKPDLNISPEIQDYIAQESGPNIRELKSAVTKIIKYIEIHNMENMDLNDAKELLESHFSGDVRKLTVEDIQKTTEHFYRVNHSDLIGKSRTKEIAWARHVAIYFCRTILNLPFKEIGEKFGGRDHTTVMHSIEKIEKEIKNVREFAEEVDVIRNTILNQ